MALHATGGLERLGHDPVRVVDFEADYLSQVPGFSTLSAYLSKPLIDQATVWNKAWQHFAKSLSTEGITLLLLHGTLVRDYYGVRIGINVQRVVDDFKPTLIVTLVDDIYRLWARTQARAEGSLAVGMPNFEHLLMARRAEAMVGDNVQRALADKNVSARHVFLAVNHPRHVLTKLISSNEPVVYLSFPITAPRELRAAGTEHAVSADATFGGINTFHRAGLRSQLGDAGFVCVSPLAIDELPFALAAKAAARRGEEAFAFDEASARWPLQAIWHEADLLGTPCEAPKRGFPTQEVLGVVPMISSDVGWRDYRLVLQAKSIACYSPVMPRPDGGWRLANGVKAELEKAAESFISCVVFQEPKFDPQRVWDSWLGTPGSMGSSTRNVYIQAVTSVGAVFEVLRKQQKLGGRR